MPVIFLCLKLNLGIIIEIFWTKNSFNFQMIVTVKSLHWYEQLFLDSTNKFPVLWSNLMFFIDPVPS